MAFGAGRCVWVRGSPAHDDIGRFEKRQSLARYSERLRRSHT
jgi:hypothetical protein